MENRQACVLVSACLLGENCKYNGGNNYNQAVIDFVSDKQVLSVCPEVAGGLPIPRKPVEIVDGSVRDADGTSYDKAFQLGIAQTLERLEGQELELAILQSRSPSCGVNQIYDGTFSGQKIVGSGLFAQALKERGYQVVDAEDINEVTS
ncbi:hypothetical protein SUT503_00340 [Streptococcus parasuis]|uniref:DUF523 domain-containing protein n=1 Tax=Streptococcus suis TaxID=1307 RepID=A0A6L8MZ46_STRSU|nr:DUF523 domain-containing protein [Streptococcus suis]NQM13649.1 DUF523 domain-containing protein [Streptococcus suis]BCP62976.1 hypothetical protein SUT503_00340 [Streptococcus parasuis]